MGGEIDAAAKQVDQDRVDQIHAEGTPRQCPQQSRVFFGPGPEPPAEGEDEAGPQRRGRGEIAVVHIDGLARREGGAPVEKGEEQQARKGRSAQRRERAAGEPSFCQKPPQRQIDQIAKIRQAPRAQQRRKPLRLVRHGVEQRQGEHDEKEQHGPAPEIVGAAADRAVQQRQGAVAQGKRREEPQMIIALQDQKPQRLSVRPDAAAGGVKAAAESGPDIEEHDQMQDAAQMAAEIQPLPAQQQRPAEQEEQRHTEAHGEAEQIPDRPGRGSRRKIPEEHHRVDRRDREAGDHAAEVEVRSPHGAAPEKFTTTRSPTLRTEPS